MEIMLINSLCVCGYNSIVTIDRVNSPIGGTLHLMCIGLTFINSLTLHLSMEQLFHVHHVSLVTCDKHVLIVYMKQLLHYLEDKEDGHTRWVRQLNIKV